MIEFALDINKINGRVDAVEKELDKRAPIVERFIQLEERDKQLINKVDVIDRKIDVILEQYIQLRNSLR